MNTQIANGIQDGLRFLANNQTSSGSFTGLSSSRPTFYNATATDTVFFTALILDCLQRIPQANSLRINASKYLMKHKGPGWTWNYWERGSTARPYPDDWDDTACAIAGLVGHNSELLSASDQALLAKSLIACETQPGGPYATWLMPGEQEIWRDIDPAVNANIGYMLTKLGVRSPSLEQYISDCLSQEHLKSPYYVGRVPVLYFMARWYKGPQQVKLSEFVLGGLSNKQTPLERAMLISAACNLGCADQIEKTQIQKLLRMQRDGAWPANSLYYEPPHNGEQHYAGSAELTTAFALEALTLWQKAQSTQTLLAEQPTSLKGLHQQLLLRNENPEVISIANIICNAGAWRLPNSKLRLLNRASRNGWLAYDLYDDFIDREGDSLHLPIANFALRQSLRYFKQAIDQADFHDLVDRVFQEVDAANLWEVQHTRDPQRLPSYGHFSKLAQRSWGHILAPTAVLVLAGFTVDSPEVQRLHNFFRHYLIAKQFCDDAHDWLEDLQANRITPVVGILLASCSEQDDASRQRHFWNYTINEVNQIIRDQLNKAQTVLDSCDFLVHKRDMQQWLDQLESVCLQAEAGREAALQFITTFADSQSLTCSGSDGLV